MISVVSSAGKQKCKFCRQYFKDVKLYNETGFKRKDDAEKFISQLKKESEYGVVKEISKKTNLFYFKLTFQYSNQ